VKLLSFQKLRMIFPTSMPFSGISVMSGYPSGCSWKVGQRVPSTVRSFNLR